ncbi:unnamed protein product, partial [Heterosigma akashiwo]
GKVWELHYLGASYIAVHFDFIVPRSGEYLRISDPSGMQSYVIEQGRKTRSSNPQTSFWAKHVKGDTMIIELMSEHDHLGTTFRIDEIGLGDPNIGNEEALVYDDCQGSDRKNAKCYSDTTVYPQYAAAQAVARLLIQGAWLCTGWLASDDNHLITNYHCIDSDLQAYNTDYEFMAETPTCNEGKDYAVIKLPAETEPNANDGGPSTHYDYLRFDMDLKTIPTDSAGDQQFRDLCQGMEIYIPQHCAGWDKMLGIESTHSSEPMNSRCHVSGWYTAGCTASSGYYEVGYYCDTLGGSSGSPVITMREEDGYHQVIALHHCG